MHTHAAAAIPIYGLVPVDGAGLRGSPRAETLLAFAFTSCCLMMLMPSLLAQVLLLLLGDALLLLAVSFPLQMLQTVYTDSNMR